MGWTSDTKTGAQSAGTVVVDTDALPYSGARHFGFFVNASVACTLLLQWRNAANNDNLAEQEVTLIAGSGQMIPSPSALAMDEDQRLRVVLKSAVLAGAISASIFSD